MFFRSTALYFLMGYIKMRSVPPKQMSLFGRECSARRVVTKLLARKYWLVSIQQHTSIPVWRSFEDLPVENWLWNHDLLIAQKLRWGSFCCGMDLQYIVYFKFAICVAFVKRNGWIHTSMIVFGNTVVICGLDFIQATL